MEKFRNRPLTLFIIAALVVILAMVLSAKIVPRHDDASRTEKVRLAKEQHIPPMDLLREQAAAGQSQAAEPLVQPARRISAVAPAPPQDYGALQPSDQAVLFALKSACRMNVMMINNAGDAWYLQNDNWPKDNLADIARDRDYFPNGIPRCPVDGSRYRLDPKSHRVAGHSHPEIKDMLSPYSIP